MDSRELMLDAVNALILSPEAVDMYQALVAVMHLAMTKPVGLTGKAAVLNPLLNLRRKDPTAFGKMTDLAEARRAAAGYEPLHRPTTLKFDKSEYMADFMDRKRQRQRHAVEIENTVRPPRDKLIGHARIAFMDSVASKWNADMNSRLETAREAAGGTLRRPVEHEIRTKFWTEIDAALDKQEEAARRGNMNPSRSAISVTDLDRALRNDPYAIS